MENILWNTWQYLVDVFDCFLILYLSGNDADTSPAAQVLLSVPSRAGGGAVRL